MRYRTFGRTGWQVSDVGYGMWGMAGWSGSDDQESHASLDQAIALGCNFFDTAWAYGDGRSERILGATLKRHAGKTLYVATKIPPKNRQWPARPGPTLEDVFPSDYIREYTEKSLTNIGRVVAGPPAVPRLERRVGGRHRLATGGARAQGRGAGQGLRDQRQSVRAGERAEGPRHRADRLGPGRLQRPRSEPGGRALPRLPGAQHRGDRPRAVRRGQPDRHADARLTLAGRGLPQPLLHAREPGRHAAADRCAQEDCAGRA